MDAILGIVGVAAAWFGVVFVMGLLSSGAKAAGRAVKKAVTGKETYFGPAQLKFIDETLPDSQLIIKKVMFRGAMASKRRMSAKFQLSAFDITDGNKNPKHVISLLEQAQEADTISFGISGEIGTIEPGDAITDWVQLGVVVPDLLQCERSGLRKIQIYLRLFNSDNQPTIVGGFGNGEGEVVIEQGISFDHNFIDKGYEEISQDREESQALSLKIGVAVAMADGRLDDAEGEILKSWILKQVSIFSDEKQKRLKGLFNDALKEAFVKAESGELPLTPLVERLANIAEKKSKYDAVALCFEVMAADGVASPEEMSMIRNIAESLGLDVAEVDSMRESVTLNLSSNITTESELESLVGLEPNWSDEQKKKHLRVEFQKWSNRINALSEGEERASAQTMLDNIARLRKKYG